MGGRKVRVAIFGGGRVGTAMAAEMPGVPVVRRGEDLECDVACVCWPAHALAEWRAAHPRAAASGAVVVAFCNGAWAEEEGMHAGVCYVRAVNLGDRAAPGRKGWRVGRPDVADALRGAGLGVTCSRGDHRAHVWGKALYIVPLAVAYAETGLDAKEAGGTPEWSEWFDFVCEEAEAEIGAAATESQAARARWLVDRSPRGWRPSSSPEEVAYFRSKLCAD